MPHVSADTNSNHVQLTFISRSSSTLAGPCYCPYFLRHLPNLGCIFFLNYMVRDGLSSIPVFIGFGKLQKRLPQQLK